MNCVVVTVGAGALSYPTTTRVRPAPSGRLDSPVSRASPAQRRRPINGPADPVCPAMSDTTKLGVRSRIERAA
jgi:hypothetical protein